MTEPFNHNDWQSATYEKVVELLNARLNRHRVENDGTADADVTAKRRGRIAECKELLLAIAPPAPREGEPTSFPSLP